MIYFGRVTRISPDDHKVHATIRALGGSHEFGPLPVASPAAFIPGGMTTPTTVGHHGAHSHAILGDSTNDIYLFPYAKDDLVLIGQVGHIKEDLIVLGKVKPPTPPTTGG